MSMSEELDFLIDVELEYLKNLQVGNNITKAEIVKKKFKYDRSRYYQIRSKYNKAIKELFGSVDQVIKKVYDGEDREEIKRKIIQKYLELEKQASGIEGEPASEPTETPPEESSPENLKEEISTSSLENEIKKELNEMKEIEEGEDEVEDEKQEEEKPKKSIFPNFLRSKWFWVILGGATIVVMILVYLGKKKKVEQIKQTMNTQKTQTIEASGYTSPREQVYQKYNLPPEF